MTSVYNKFKHNSNQFLQYNEILIYTISNIYIQPNSINIIVLIMIQSDEDFVKSSYQTLPSYIKPKYADRSVKNELHLHRSTVAWNVIRQ